MNKIKQVIAISVLSAVTVQAIAAEKPTASEERRGALAGAVVGAAVAGPVGAGAGAIIGGGVFGKLFGMNRINRGLTRENQDLASKLDKTHGDYEREQDVFEQRIAALNKDLDFLVSQSSTLTRRELPIQFRTGSSDIEPHYANQLRDTAKLLGRNPDTKVVLSGYADRRGDETYNQTLSESRVREVKAFLLSHGVGKHQVVTHAFGESQPVSEAESAEAHFFDRRVVMAFEMDVNGKLATR